MYDPNLHFISSVGRKFSPTTRIELFPDVGPIFGKILKIFTGRSNVNQRPDVERLDCSGSAPLFVTSTRTLRAGLVLRELDPPK